MDITFIASELLPYSGSSSTAELAAALPKALRGLDHRVTVVSPLLSGIDPARRALARRLSKVEVELAGTRYEVEVYDGRTSGGVEVVFLGHELFGEVEALAPHDDALAALRAGLFAKASATLAATREPAASVIHAHGWVGALALTQLRMGPRPTLRAVLTLHGHSDQVGFSTAHADVLGLEGGARAAAEIGGRLHPVLAGIRAADRVATVSPTFSQELTGGDDALGQRMAEHRDELSAVLNGVDASTWNPATDAKLHARFDPVDLSGKARNKAHLQRTLGLPVRDDIPLVGVLANATPGGGFDLVASAGARILRNDCQLAVAWSGDADDDLRQRLEALAERWPDRIQLRDDDGDVSHEVLGAADLVIVPSRQDAGSSLQMIAHRYGALPVVRRTGGLADTVVDCDPRLRTGTGFVFDQASDDDLLAAVRRAVAAFADADRFEALRRRVMKLDHSWERAARLYERLYAGRDESEAA